MGRTVHKMVATAVGLASGMILGLGQVDAQSTFDLEPPTQSASTIQTSSPAGPIVPLVFAVAELNSDGKLEIVRSIPKRVPIDKNTVVVPVQQTFTVQVPYTELVDGKQVTRTRSETRTRTVEVIRGPSKIIAQQVKETVQLDEVSCFSSDGEPLKAKTVKKRLAERAAIILFQDKEQIHPFFKELVKPETVFIVMNSPANKLHPNRAVPPKNDK